MWADSAEPRILDCTKSAVWSASDMDLDVDVYRAQDDHIFLTVKGPAQGLVQFPDLTTLVAFLIDCQVLLESFEGAATLNSNAIPDCILEAFGEDPHDGGAL